MQNIVKIDSSVTQKQRDDPRFQTLHRQYEDFFSSPGSEYYKLMLGLHEVGHAYFAKKSGATNIRYRGPRMLWDARPQYNCPAISRSATVWTPATNGSILGEMKAQIAGYVVRRELSDTPNDEIAIESDLESCRKWFDAHVGTGEEAFQAALQDAEREILDDLKSPTTVADIWAEAHRFVSEMFPTVGSVGASRVKLGNYARQPNPQTNLTASIVAFIGEDQK